MTVSPATPPRRRLALTAACAALLLVLGVLALREFGVGPSVFLFALALVCVIDAVQVQRRHARRRAAG